MTPLRTASRSLTRVLVLTAALLVGVVPALPAHAEPTIAEIEAQISKTWEKLEPLIEEYNKVHSDLKKLQKKAATIEAKLAPLRMTVEVTRTRVGVIAAEYYKGGRNAQVNALISSGSPKQFAEQLMILEQLAHGKQEQIAATSEAKAKFDVEKDALDKAIADQKAKDTDMAGKKKVIEAEMTQLQKLRTQAYGSGGGGGGALRIGNACPAQQGAGKGQIAAAWACKQISKKYVWGSNGPNTFDCSGLTQQAWKAAGVSLTHYTKEQWGEGARISSANAKVGDLVFFFGDLHHVGIYVGTVGGERVMVHAPHTGDVVRMAYIKYMPVAGYVRPS